ncbi:MAG: fibronectin type III domain-containing protein [Opitutaceae bacterium]|nr:fibronectin type III domain-containing protein [Opitutaceae bacterium]
MHHSRFALLASLLIAALCLPTGPAFGQGLIVDHTKTTITQIPEAAILQAKQTLRIAYGHTSHGSQLIDGMNGLVGFMNGRGYPNNLYAWNEAGSNGALRLDDNAFSSFGADDLGAPNRTAWDGATRSYLAANPSTNVIIWSWCGQVDGSQAEIQNYLDRMSQLERDFPAVRFVYMTGHLNGGGATGNVNVRNNQIRAYCLANNKTLYDFADIESYDPDGLVHYMPLNCDDGCNYTSGGVGHNWATEWQAAHTQNVDWYNCGAAHSQPLNANRKAYAAWWLWARLAGWAGPVADSTPPTVPASLHTTSVAYNRVELAWSAAVDAESGVSGYRIYRGGAFLSFATGTSYADATVSAGESYTYTVRAVNGASLLSGDSNTVTADTPVPTDTQDPSVPGNLQAGAITTTTLHLTWNASTDNIGVTGYRVYRDGSLRTTVAGTSFDDSGLTPATSYSYRVSALDAAGNESDQSAARTVQTTDPTDTEPPSVPNGLTVGTVTSTTVQLSWNAATDNNAVAGTMCTATVRWSPRPRARALATLGARLRQRTATG